MERNFFEIQLLDLRQSLKDDLDRMRRFNCIVLSEFSRTQQALAWVNNRIRSHRMSRLGISVS